MRPAGAAAAAAIKLMALMQYCTVCTHALLVHDCVSDAKSEAISNDHYVLFTYIFTPESIRYGTHVRRSRLPARNGRPLPVGLPKAPYVLLNSGTLQNIVSPL